MAFDVGRVLSFSFSWLRDRQSLSYSAAFWVIGAVAVIGAYLLGADMSGSRAVMTAGDAGYAALSFVLSFVTLYIGGLIILFALKKRGLGNIPFGFMNYLRYIVLILWVGIAALFSLYNKKFIPLWVAGLVLCVAGFISLFSNPLLGIMLLIVGFLVLVAYAVVMLYNATRLVFAYLYFFSKDQPIAQSCRDSLAVTKGAALGIFGILLLVAFIAYIVFLVLFMVLLALYALFALASGASLFSLFIGGAQGGFFLATLAVQYILMPILVFFITFGETDLFAQVRGGSVSALKQAVAAAHPAGTVAASGSKDAPARRPLAKNRAASNAAHKGARPAAGAAKKHARR